MLCIELEDCGVMYLKILLIWPNACIVLLAALVHCIKDFMVESTQLPESLVSSTDDQSWGHYF